MRKTKQQSVYRKTKPRYLVRFVWTDMAYSEVKIQDKLIFLRGRLLDLRHAGHVVEDKIREGNVITVYLTYKPELVVKDSGLK